MSISNLPVKPSSGGGERLVRAYVDELLEASESSEKLKSFIGRWQALFELQQQWLLKNFYELLYWNPPNDLSNLDEDAIKKLEKRKALKVWTEKELEFTCQLIHNDFDVEQAVGCILKSRKGTCEHAEVGGCVGIHVAIPGVLLEAEEVALQYKIPVDIAFIQMFRGMAE